MPQSKVNNNTEAKPRNKTRAENKNGNETYSNKQNGTEKEKSAKFDLLDESDFKSAADGIIAEVVQDHYEPTEIVGNNTISNDTTVVETENKQNSSETVGKDEKQKPVNVNSTNESSALNEDNKTTNALDNIPVSANKTKAKDDPVALKQKKIKIVLENANLEFKKASDLVKKKLDEVDALINGADEVVIVNKTEANDILVSNQTEAKKTVITKITEAHDILITHETEAKETVNTKISEMIDLFTFELQTEDVESVIVN